jgi:hypothetical protein
MGPKYFHFHLIELNAISLSPNETGIQEKLWVLSYKRQLNVSFVKQLTRHEKTVHP